jgi:hypothetical protein
LEGDGALVGLANKYLLIRNHANARFESFVILTMHGKGNLIIRELHL